VTGRLAEGSGEVRGYEIHMGLSQSRESPLFYLRENGSEKAEGAISADGMVMGSYVHGLFDLPAFRSAFLSKIPYRESKDVLPHDYDRSVQEGLDALASVVGSSLDMNRLLAILKEGL
jgi:adenosylcobyric acid synthase